MLQTLRSYWESLRSNDDLPLRSDIDPRQIPEVLDSLFILERLGPEDVRVRIAGLALCEMMGMEVRGQSPLTFFAKDTRQRFAAMVGEVLARPMIARLGLETVDRMGNEARVNMLLLPLRSDFGDVSRIIGCVTTPKGGFTAPLRFHIRTIDMEPIRPNTSTLPASRFGFSEPDVGFIMDGSTVIHTIAGGSETQAVRKVQSPSYLKLVD